MIGISYRVFTSKTSKEYCLVSGYDQLPTLRNCLVRLGTFLWQDSPNAGDPDCLCSLCLERISADEVPIRMWPFEGMEMNVKGELRFHLLCYEFAMGCAFGKDDDVKACSEIMKY